MNCKNIVNKRVINKSVAPLPIVFIWT